MAKEVEATVCATIADGAEKFKVYFLEYFPNTTHRKVKNLERKLFAKAASENRKIRIEAYFLKYAKPFFESQKISG